MSAPPSVSPRPWPRRRDDRLAPGQQGLMVAGVLAAHVAALWGLLQVQQVRDAVAEAVPMIFNIVQAPQPVTPTPAPKPLPQPHRAPTPPAPLIAAEPSPAPAPAAFVAPVQPAPQPAPTPEPIVTQAPPAPLAPPPPRTISASEVQFLKVPTLQYPAASRRARETGRVMLRIFIDERGLPRTVQISRSSGFSRLDEAAVATIQQALFKPYAENGQPIGVWAQVPFDFDLEK